MTMQDSNASTTMSPGGRYTLGKGVSNNSKPTNAQQRKQAAAERIGIGRG